MAEFDNLVRDVYKLLETTSLELTPSFYHDVEQQKPTLRMSNLGQPLRKLYYELTQAPKIPIDGQSLFKFSYGHLIEALFFQLAIAAGHEVKDQQREVFLDGVRGRTDGSIDDVLVDVKSCSQYSFDKFKSGKLAEADSFGYIPQLSGYWACLPEYKRCAFIAVNKINGEIFVYELQQSKRTSEGELRSKIVQVREAINSGVIPERCYEDQSDGKSGNRCLSTGCNYCAFKFHCWSDSNGGRGLQVYNYSNGKRYLTKVIRPPKVDQEEPVKDFKIKNV